VVNTTNSFSVYSSGVSISYCVIGVFFGSEYFLLCNSRLHTEVESVSFLSRAKIVYQGVAAINSIAMHKLDAFLVP
jgi:hypothetical protein